MNKDNNLNFEKKLTNPHESKTSKSLPQREQLKLKIMNKYHLNSYEAEKIICKIEKKEGINRPKIKTFNNNKNKKTSPNYSNFNSKKINNNTNFIQNEKYSAKSNHFKDKNASNQKNNSSKLKKKVMIPNINENKKTVNHEKHTEKIQTPKKDVDSIISDIIPKYNNQISIELSHVDLTFEVQNEKVDTLKETFIRTLKRNKSKKFKIHALKDISFKIYKGEKIGIIGYNGAGKSTLLNVITGIYPPDKGCVKTTGNISPLLSLGAGFDLNFSGRKNIFLNGAVLGYDKNFLESKVDEIIEFSELGDFIDIPIKNYSSGMIAKLGFSIATSVNPDILIIDEILGVGDVNFRKKSSDKMKSLMDGGTTVLIVSHSIPQIRELCDKAIWIDNGHLKDMGEVNKICDKYLKDAENASNKQLANIELNAK